MMNQDQWEWLAIYFPRGIFFDFHPSNLEKINQSLSHIFQRGWNYQWSMDYSGSGDRDFLLPGI